MKQQHRTTWPHTPRRVQRRRGFTLIELMFVIGVIGITLGLAFPAITALTAQVDTSAGVNAINTAITAARAVAVEPKQGARFQDIDGSASLDGYSGAAMIVTPAGEIRFAMNTPYAQSAGNDFLELISPDNFNGYADVPNLDAVELPGNAGVVGLVRSDTGAPSLIPPPFGIRFNEDGHLIPSATSTTGNNAPKMIVYDSDGDGTYDRSADRTSSYNPDSVDPAYGSPSRTSEGQWSFDIEIFESVAAVAVYDENDFRNSGHSLAATGAGGNPISTTARDWILANGTVLFFNRYSGVVFSEKGD